MKSILILILSIFAVSTANAQGQLKKRIGELHQLSKEVDFKDLTQQDRRTLRRHVNQSIAILESYADPAESYFCDGRNLNSHQSGFIVTLGTNSRCDTAVAISKQGGQYFCDGRNLYAFKGGFLVTLGTNSRCDTAVAKSLNGAEHYCDGRNLYSFENGFMVTLGTNSRCDNAVNVSEAGQEFYCDGRNLYSLETGFVQTLGTNSRCQAAADSGNGL